MKSLSLCIQCYINPTFNKIFTTNKKQREIKKKKYSTYMNLDVLVKQVQKVYFTVESKFRLRIIQNFNVGFQGILRELYF